MKQFLFFAFLLAVGFSFSACKNDACADIVCQNGGTCDEGICECPTGYTGTDCGTQLSPTSVVITRTTLHSFRQTQTSGDTWDAPGAGQEPDVYLTYALGDNINNHFLATEDMFDIGNSVLPLTIVSGHPITLQSPPSLYSIGIWDFDGAVDQFVAGISFRPTDFAAGFPESIMLESNVYSTPTRIELDLQWNFE